MTIHLPLDERQNVRLVRRYGVAIFLFGSLLSLVEAVGLWRRSYWAVAGPVAAAAGAVAALLIWLGATLATTPMPPEELS